jgi:hypothetical protein
MRLFFCMKLHHQLGVAFLLLLIMPAVVSADSIDEVKGMARAGAPELALSMIHRFQPEYEKMPVRWASWETVSLNILEEQGRWQDIIDRIGHYPAQLPEAFSLNAQSTRARAFLESGRPEQALPIYRSLIWNAGDDLPPEDWRRWRLGIIRAYMAQGLQDQALIAWRRYEQDFPQLGTDELELRARLAMQAGHPDEAVDVLRSVDSPTVMPVLLLAQLDSGALKPKKVIAQVDATVKKTDEKTLPELWWVAASAAQASRDGRSEIIYLQRALQQKVPPEKDKLFPLDPDQLWDAYTAYGEFLGNQQGLLVGDDEAWFKLAESEKDSLKKEAYYAVTAIEGQNKKAREKGHAGLVKVLIDTDNSTLLLYNLYLHSANFPTVAYVPEVVRPLLAESALERGDSQLASKLMQGISAPPAGADSFDWELRRARIHILGGNEDLGIDVLYGIVGRYKEMDAKQIDRFLQVLFDLQTLKRDKEAIALFNALQPRLTTAKQRRELLFWMADSYKSLGQNEQAGYLYLRSATLLDGSGLDPWGQTARFFAAECLANAGLIDDSRNLYQGLLRVTQDANRKMVLRQRLQHLQLME